MTDLVELINAYRERSLELSGLLDAVTARGPLPERERRSALAWLERQREEGGIDAALADALTLRLRVPPPSAAGAGADDDATVVKPSLREAGDAEDAATVVQPVAAAPAGPGDEGTVVKPRSQRMTGPTTDRRDTDGGFDRAAWGRIAAAQDADRAGVGTLLKGRFLLERELGRGGMGVVYLARDERKVEARDRDPYVAVKVLNDEFRRHPDALVALQREARRAQQLGHDNIVRVYDFDKHGTIVFMTMEYIDGLDLRRWIRERAFEGVPLATAWPLIEGMAAALERAHASGVVHSDFKPGNVMVTRAGVPKVFDFGIARAGKFVDPAADEQTVFDAGTLGALTPAYASLEMIQGRPPTPADDVYALGCVVFELLTGRHPYDKANAETASNEGLRPPPVPGLGKRQYRALCASVAWRGGQRLQSARELVEGLRPRGLRERFGPALAATGVLALALAAGGWGVSRYLGQRQVSAVAARFAAGPQAYADEDQAVQALDALGPERRSRLVLEQSEVIQDFLLRRLDGYWNPAAGRTDFAGGQHIWKLRNALKLFSPALDARHELIVRQRNDLLNTLDTQLDRAVQAGALFDPRPDGVAAVLARLRAVDPDSARTKQAELELKYDDAAAQALAAGDAGEAARRLEVGLRLFPDSRRLQRRRAQLPAASPQDRPAAEGTAASPSAAGAWQAGASAQSRSAAATDWPRQDGTAAGEPWWQAAVRPGAAPAERPAAAPAPRYAPDSAAQRLQRDRLLALLPWRQVPPPAPDPEAVGAEVASRIESVRLGAAANDSDKALESLERIKAVQPDNPFLASEGPQLVGGAFLARARAICQQGRWRDAAGQVGEGIKALGNRPELRNAKERYELVAAIAATRDSKAPVGVDVFRRLQARLAAARKADPAGVKQLESDMIASGKLPQGSLDALMDLLATKVAPAAPGQDAVGERPDAAAGSALAIPRGADPCARADLAGQGSACVDTLSDGSRGPALVVIPAMRGGRAFAMAREEIGMADFNRFCAQTRRCPVSAPPARDGDRLPARGIYLAQARSYASWLTAMSGYVYRLPTDEEWLYAARAGRGWLRAGDSRCQLPNGAAVDGPVGRGGANPWGLVNLAGNVGEWVLDGSRVLVRGGSYRTRWSDCTVNLFRADKGLPQDDVGFRLVRELK